MHYEHQNSDPLSSNQPGHLVISSHANKNIAYIYSKIEATAPTLYIHTDDVPSAIVALLANTGFTEREPQDEREAELIKLGQEFIDTFRENMVPRFREEFREAIDEADNDWDAKCRVSDIIRKYEDLR